MEAKAKIKALKQAQIEKKTEKKVAEGALRGGERACTECGGSGMVYEEPKAIPDAVKGKVAKYNTMMKATKAAHKRMDANHNGIPDEDEMEEDFGSNDKEMKVGDKKKTRTGELTKTSTGVVHKNTSYADDGDADEKSGKGTKSHAKSQSAAEKKEKAPAQKQSPKSAKTWGMKDSEKFDNRDGAPAKPKKEKDVDETYGQGVYEAKKKGDGNLANNAKPYDKITKGDVIAGRLGKDEKGGKDKKVKEAATMWNSVKETAAYMAEKKAIEKKDKPMKGNKIAGEGNAYGNAVRNTPDGEEIKINGKGTGDIKKESTDFTRMQEQLARLNRSETKTAINENSEVNRLRTLTNLLKG
jgi:hypothetical protein